MKQSAPRTNPVSKRHRQKYYLLFFSFLLGFVGLSFYVPTIAQTDFFHKEKIPKNLTVGQVLGCEGTPLKNYTGFSVGLYHRDRDTPGGIQGLVSLPSAASELSPNLNNKNPFPLSNPTQGRFNFVLEKDTINPDTRYILIIKPPENSRFGERRIELRFGQASDDFLPFTATAFDGLPINFNQEKSQRSGRFLILEKGNILLSLNLGICDQKALRITKTSDRAATSVGEVAVYRLRVENLATGDLENLAIKDTLPRGFQLREESIQGELGGNNISLTHHVDQQTFTLKLPPFFPPNQILKIAYATEITADALRGDGENTVTVEATDSRNGIRVQDGLAIHKMRVTGDLLSNTGTIIGRVFVDKNFDGEQQANEPGIPNAIIFLDNGMQVTTDVAGLFSIKNVRPGLRTGILDLSSLQGYTLAPNHYFIEGNSPSRLVNLPPRGTVRMNFAVTLDDQE